MVPFCVLKNVILLVQQEKQKIFSKLVNSDTVHKCYKYKQNDRSRYSNHNVLDSTRIKRSICYSELSPDCSRVVWVWVWPSGGNATLAAKHAFFCTLVNPVSNIQNRLKMEMNVFRSNYNLVSSKNNCTWENVPFIVRPDFEIRYLPLILMTYKHIHVCQALFSGWGDDQEIQSSWCRTARLYETI